MEVSFETDVPMNTLYQLQLFKLVPNGVMPPTALVLQQMPLQGGVAPETAFGAADTSTSSSPCRPTVWTARIAMSSAIAASSVRRVVIA